MASLDDIKRIYEVLGSKAVLLPLRPGTKKCLVKAWQKTKLEDTKVAAYVAELITSNIGVSLGAPSSGLCSIDFDEGASAALFLEANPMLQGSLRTRGARGCNIWVQIEGEYPAPSKLLSLSLGKPVGEWRSSGNYTAIHGKHPSGSDYTWVVDAPVVFVQYTDIIWPADISVCSENKSVRREPGKTLADTILDNRRKLASKVLDSVVWDDSKRGYCICPGKSKHMNGDGPRDCELMVDGIPTIHCFHSSCKAEVDRMNIVLRGKTLDQEIVILPDGYASVQDSAEQLYETLNTTKKFYNRGTVVEVVESGAGPSLSPVGRIRAVSAWEKWTKFGERFFKDGEERITPCPLPERWASVFLECDEKSILPAVEGVVTCPVLYKDGPGNLSIHSSGYNPQTRLFVSNASTLPLPTVTLAEAVDAIKDLVSDFTFEAPSHRSRAIFSFITPALVFSGLLGGRPPVDVAEADESQSGKGYRHRMLAALYSERPSMVAQRKGGVGGLDESFQEALIRGRPFLCLDNVRGKLDSTYIEAFLTAPDTIGARGFGKAEVEVSVQRFITLISSNDLQMTTDLANRSSVIRIHKHADSYAWKRYGPDNVFVIDWIIQNQPFYLACVYRVVQEWYKMGCPTSPKAADHDFHWWAGRGEWIINHFFNEAPMMDGHRAIQTRAGDGRLGWFQRLAIQAEKSGRLGLPMKMVDLLGLCGEGGFETYRKSGDLNRQFNDDATELRYLGGIFGPLFTREKGDLKLDGYRVYRSEMKTSRQSTGQDFTVKCYTFRKNGDDSPLPVLVPQEDESNVSRTNQEPAVSFLDTVGD